METSRIMAFLDKFEEARKSRCDIVNLFNSYSRTSSTFAPTSRKIFNIKKSNRSLDYLLDNPTENCNCYIEGECRRCNRIDMLWQYSVISGKKNVLVAKTAGVMDKRNTISFTKDIMRYAIKAKVEYFLIDHRNAKMNFSEEEINYITVLAIKNGFTDSFKAAVLYSEPNAEIFQYLNTLCQNVNLNIRCFVTLEKVLAYLG